MAKPHAQSIPYPKSKLSSLATWAIFPSLSLRLQRYCPGLFSRLQLPPGPTHPCRRVRDGPSALPTHFWWPAYGFPGAGPQTLEVCVLREGALPGPFEPPLTVLPFWEGPKRHTLHSVISKPPVALSAVHDVLRPASQLGRCARPLTLLSATPIRTILRSARPSPLPWPFFWNPTTR